MVGRLKLISSFLVAPLYVGEKIPHTPLGGDIKQAGADARARVRGGSAQISRKQTADRAPTPITTVSEHPPTGRRPTSVTLVSGLAAASCRLGHDDMGI